MSIKKGKAAGIDGIYPEFVHNFGLRTKMWILNLFNKILESGNLPPLFKKAKIVTILKPNKDGLSASDYRPISLLSVMYKLLARLIFNRIEPIINQKIPKTQIGFRKNRSCTNQVMALTCFIESGFQKKK